MHKCVVPVPSAGRGIACATAATCGEADPHGVLAGPVDTPLWDELPGAWDRARMLEPEDVARAIVDAARQLPHAAIDEIVLGHVGRPLNG